MAGTKLSDAEVEARIDACFRQRYGEHGGLLYKEWIDHCHKAYKDKSEKQYTQYWIKAGERYEAQWREKLSKMLDPAANELYRLLASDKPKIRQRAIDQIMKYTGNDIQRIEGDIKLEQINLTWGDAEQSDD